MSSDSGDSALYRRLWSLSWPLILSNITVPLLGLVDTAVLGHLDSPVYLGAVAIGSNLFTIFYWSFGFLRMGTTGMTAQATGADDRDSLRRLLLQSLLMGTLLGLAIVLLQVPLVHFGVLLMHPEPTVQTLAEQYCRIRVLSAPAVLAQYALMGWLIGRQDTRAPFYIAVATNLLNLALDLLFVLGLHMTSSGVAWATMLSEYAALLFGISLVIRRHPEDCKLDGVLAWLWHWPDYVRLLRLNRYIFVRTIAIEMVFAFFTAQGARMGTDVLAANAVLMTFLLLMANGLDGFANATEILIGEAVGGRRQQALQRSLNAGLRCAGVAAVQFSLAYWLGGDWLINRLTDLQSVATEAHRYLPWMMLLPVLAVWSFLFDGVFIGATKVRAMQNTMLFSATLFLLSWWLSQSLANHGLWLAICVFMLARGGSQALVSWHYSRKQRWF